MSNCVCQTWQVVQKGYVSFKMLYCADDVGLWCFVRGGSIGMGEDCRVIDIQSMIRQVRCIALGMAELAGIVS